MKAATYMGKPCKRGHSGLRYKANKHCRECEMLDKRIRYNSLTYIGRPCKHGHRGRRYLSNNKCVACYKNQHRQSKGTYTGQPCKHGHGNLRYVSNRRCVQCDKLDNQINREYHMLYLRMRRRTHPRTPEQIKRDCDRLKAWRRDQHPGYYKTEKFEEAMAVSRNTMIALREMGVRI